MESAVRNLFVKTGKGRPMLAPADERVLLIPSFGVRGDANASETSPRQVLIAFEPSIAELGVQPGDLKENILLTKASERDFPSGTGLRIGTAVIRITIPCEPCGYLKTVGIERPASACGRRGMLGVVIEGGTVCIGDRAERLQSAYPVLPERLTDRLAWIIVQIPKGKVVGYSALAHLAGVSRAYLRAFPGILRRLEAQNVPIHRVVDSKGRLIGCVHNQKEKLEREGVPLNQDGVDDLYTWSGIGLYSAR
ncbi:hypothetical protein EON81_10945 [bacterium]|nr:MAG: hypothetical protein EON81_10945 [bacterium]